MSLCSTKLCGATKTALIGVRSRSSGGLGFRGLKGSRVLWVLEYGTPGFQALGVLNAWQLADWDSCRPYLDTKPSFLGFPIMESYISP